MRLLDTTTLRLKEFPASAIPQYVILSHTWSDEEILYADVENGTANRKRGYRKLVNCCERAKMDGYQWIWIDTCCIDKSSSAEISESINSMFRWYQNSQICYAYLADVKGHSTSEDIVGQFKSSLWFTRGWTLQELIGRWRRDTHYFSYLTAFLGPSDISDITSIRWDLERESEILWSKNYSISLFHGLAATNTYASTFSSRSCRVL